MTTTSDTTPAQEPRSSTPNVLGILSIVFGSIVVLLTLLALVQNPLDSMLLRAMDELGPAVARLRAAIEPWSTISSVVMLLMGGSLIFVGVGQRGYRRWARGATITWSGVALAVTATQVLLQVLVFNPASGAFAAEVLDGALSSLASNAGVGGVVLTLLLYLPYPIVQLVLVRRPEVEAAMNA